MIGTLIGNVGSVAVLVVPSALRAQGRDLQDDRPIKVRVRVTTASIAGGTTTLGYTIENLRSGDENFTAFLVAAPPTHRSRWLLQ